MDFKEMEIAITNKCNYNCLHCFNTKDEKNICNELKLEEVYKILDEAKLCGVKYILLTGGEPMLHPNFKEIVLGIFERGMILSTVVTNASFITQEYIEWFKNLPVKPIFHISFDCVGYHDWMRNKKGAEQDTINAIQMLHNNDFYVQANVNINKINYKALQKTTDLLEMIGIQRIRIIRTSDAPRWLATMGKGKSLSMEEWYKVSLKFLKKYLKKDHTCELDVWNFAFVYPNRRFLIAQRRCCESKYSDNIPMCWLTAQRMFIQSDGSLYPCPEISGLLRRDGISLGNAITDSLVDIVLDENSEYMKYARGTVGERIKRNEECQKCPHWKKCIGGCPVYGYAHFGHLTEKGNIYGIDRSRCVFFKKGYEEKILKVIPKDYEIINN